MKTAYEEWRDEIMERVADLTVAEALSRGMVVKCPTCGVIHPGIRYMHRDHYLYCSTPCFRGRKR